MGNALALDESNVIVTDDPLLEVRMPFISFLRESSLSDTSHGPDTLLDRSQEYKNGE